MSCGTSRAHFAFGGVGGGADLLEGRFLVEPDLGGQRVVHGHPRAKSFGHEARVVEGSERLVRKVGGIQHVLYVRHVWPPRRLSAIRVTHRERQVPRRNRVETPSRVDTCSIGSP
jgi:hypothetical protein